MTQKRGRTQGARAGHVAGGAGRRPGNLGLLGLKERGGVLLGTA